MPTAVRRARGKLMYTVKIPKIVMPDVKSITASAAGEPFVDIEDYSKGVILVDLQYLKAGRAGAVSSAYMRRGVADRLLSAWEQLPEGYTFKIYDAWRSVETQSDLYYEYYNKLASDGANRGLSSEELHKMARTFVSFPDTSAEFSFVHSSGGAIDLTVIDENGVELDMGCGFDDFSDLAETCFFEEEGKDPTARQNRRILYRAMTAAGFTNYPCEWWHYDFGDIFWSAITGKPAVYASEYDVKKVIG